MPTKRDVESGAVVDGLTDSVAPVTSSGESFPAVSNPARRDFLRRGSTLAGGVLASGATLAAAAPLAVPESATTFGKPIPEDDYGMPSKYEGKVRRRRTDVFKNRQNFSDWSMTPLQYQYGIITPNGLIFERHHNGTPDIDPCEAPARDPRHGEAAARVHDGRPAALPGGVEVPLPRMLGQRSHRLAEARLVTVQQTHGLLSCGQWTGVPVSWLLDEAGIDPGAKWVMFEGADGASHVRSVPLKKVLDDCLVVYCAERRDAARRKRLSAAVARPRLGRQRQRQMAASDEGRRSALELPQRNGALHRPDAGGHVAPVQLRHGVQVGHHASVRRDVDQAGHARDPGPRVVGQRQDSRGRRDARWREDVAGSPPRRSRARQMPGELPLPMELGRRSRDDRQPCRRQHRLRAAVGAGHHEGSRDRRLRPASQRRAAVVGQRHRGGEEMPSARVLPRFYLLSRRSSPSDARRSRAR
jgi:hypothetical protein